MKLQGYLVDEEEFDVKPAISRMFVTTEIETKRNKPVARFIKDDTENDKSLKVVVQFLPGAPTTLRFSTDNKTNFSSVDTDNITTYTIHLNGSPVSVPFVAEPTDRIIINIVKTDSNKISEINLRGLIII